MNYKLSHIPDRGKKPRQTGVTMVMDKGMSIRQAEDFIDACAHLADVVKLGFGTSIVSPKLKDKIKLYQSAGIRPYFGGTLFEAFLVRKDLDGYLSYIDKFGVDMVEVSDGSMQIDHDEKLRHISNFAQNFTVFSEVGSKQKGVVIPPEEWVSHMKSELEAGSWKVIAEARESGTIGIYNPDGSVYIDLVNSIIKNVKMENVLWEAPSGKQQGWFIKQFGSKVNLGNIAPIDLIPLETLRLGLRGDTFFDFLPSDLHSQKSSIDLSTIIDFQI